MALVGAPPALLTPSGRSTGPTGAVSLSPGRHVLYSGTTIHGMPVVLTADGRARGAAGATTTVAAPLGQVLTALLADPREVRIGAVGLGAGAVAAYGRPG